MEALTLSQDELRVVNDALESYIESRTQDDADGDIAGSLQEKIQKQMLVDPWWVLVKDQEHLVIPNAQATMETIRDAEMAGFKIVWDSAPSEIEGARYAARAHGAPVPVNKKVVR